MSNWYPTLEYVRDLVQQKLAIEKIDGNLSTFKYARKVHFDNLWDKVPFMKEIRGIVYDNTTGELVQAPPQKSFNYLENGHWSDITLDTPVTAYKKYNGFMACATVDKKHGLVVSTTGTTNSEYAQWAREEIPKNFQFFPGGATVLFEIVIPQDPHIVEEPLGAHVLGVRSISTGIYSPYGKQGSIARSLDSVIKQVQDVRHEGFMVYTADGRCCKLKSPYYLGKKFVMRSNAQSVELMYDASNGFSYCNRLDARWVPIVRKITYDVPKEQWLQLTDQQRRAIIEVYEKEYW